MDDFTQGYITAWTHILQLGLDVYTAYISKKPLPKRILKPIPAYVKLVPLEKKNEG